MGAEGLTTISFLCKSNLCNSQQKKWINWLWTDSPQCRMLCKTSFVKGRLAKWLFVDVDISCSSQKKKFLVNWSPYPLTPWGRVDKDEFSVHIWIHAIPHKNLSELSLTPGSGALTKIMFFFLQIWTYHSISTKKRKKDPHICRRRLYEAPGGFVKLLKVHGGFSKLPRAPQTTPNLQEKPKCVYKCVWNPLGTGALYMPAYISFQFFSSTT